MALDRRLPVRLADVRGGPLAIRPDYYKYWGWAWVVLAAMIAWTAVSSVAYGKPVRRTWLLLSADLIVTALALVSTAVLQTPHATTIGVMPVTATWLAGPALAWAVAGGARAGVAAALVIGACVVWLRWPFDGKYSSTVLDGPVILLLAAALVGYVSILSARAEQALQRATEIEAASRERERLARRIHDSVLQVLAMVQRRGAEAGGEAAALGELAGEQEAALRALITGDDLGSAGYRRARPQCPSQPRGIGLGVGDYPGRSRHPHRTSSRGNDGGGQGSDRQCAAALRRDRQGVGTR